MIKKNMLDCRGRSPEELIVAGELDETSRVREIPYFGPKMAPRLYGRTGNSIKRVIQYFSHPRVPKSAEWIEKKVSLICQNPNRGRCIKGYHVADVNVCAFNSLLNLLVFSHNNPDYFSFEINIPNATNVAMRRRAVNDDTNSTRRCGCLNAYKCRRDNQCVWNTAAQTGLRHGACTPRAAVNTKGFVGREEPWENGAPVLAQKKRELRGPQARVVGGQTYVRGWRLRDRSPTAVRRNSRRAARDRSPTAVRRNPRRAARNLRGGEQVGYNHIKAKIEALEKNMSTKLLPERRRLNAVLKGGSFDINAVMRLHLHLNELER